MIKKQLRSVSCSKLEVKRQSPRQLPTIVDYTWRPQCDIVELLSHPNEGLKKATDEGAHNRPQDWAVGRDIELSLCGNNLLRQRV